MFGNVVIWNPQVSVKGCSLHKLHAQGSKTLYRKHLILINQDDPAQEGYERIAESFCKLLAL